MPTTSSPDAAHLPTDRDLDRLACAVRMAAQDRDLPDRVIEWYEDWIFLFVGWCLKAPPHRVHRDRINDFWWALTDHPKVRRWKVCQAMDALGMLFGALDGADVLSFPEGESSTEEDTTPADGLEDPSCYLPEGRLPEAVEPRAGVPTRAEPREPATTDVDPSPAAEAPSGDDRAAPKTLFNPTGASSAAADRPQDEENVAAEADADDAPDPAQNEDLESVEVPRAAAERLRAAAQALDLPEPLLVARAIDLLREEVGEVGGEAAPESGPLRRYQAQVELLHRHGTADLPSLDASDGADEAKPASEASRETGAASAVRLGVGRGDGWTGQVPVLEIRGN